MPDGPMLRTHQPRRARTQRDFHLGSAFGSNRTGPTDAGSDIDTDQAGFHKKNCFVVGMRSLTGCA